VPGEEAFVIWVRVHHQKPFWIECRLSHNYNLSEERKPPRKFGQIKPNWNLEKVGNSLK
jgi:hypothetical protein